MSDILTLDDLPEITETQEDDLVHVRRGGEDKKIRNTNFAAKTTTEVELITTITFGQPVSATGNLGSNDATANAVLAGLAIEGGAAAEVIKCQKVGQITLSSHGYTVGTQYYLGPAGTFVPFGELSTDLIVPCFVPTDVDTLDLNVQPIAPRPEALGGVPIGGIMPFGMATPPTGWLECDGSAVSRASYSSLFSAIGTTFGVGDGSTTFNLPDPREAAIIATGTNTTHTIASSNPLALGDFQDDQMQQITGSISNTGNVMMLRSGSTTNEGALSAESGSSLMGSGGNASYKKINFDSATSPDARTGTTTHGKQFGAMYAIKAAEVTGRGDLVHPPWPEKIVDWFILTDVTNARYQADYSLVDGLAGFELPDIDVLFYISQTGSDSDSILVNHLTSTTASFGYETIQAAVDRIDIQTGATGLAYLSTSTGGATNVPTTWYGKIVLKKRVHTDLAILQNNGGYNYEEYHDISTTGFSVNLTSIYNEPDGFIASYYWNGGDGTAQITFDGGTYTGKTIGGIDADTLAADLAGDGQGRLTIRKDGNNLRILHFSDVDGGNWTSWRWAKTTTGVMTQNVKRQALFFPSNDGREDFTWAIEWADDDYALAFLSDANNADGSNPAWISTNSDQQTTTQFRLSSETRGDTGPGAVRYITGGGVGRWTQEHPEVG